MSRYQVLQNYVEDDESIAAYEQAEDTYEEAVDPIWAICARDQEQHPEEYHYDENLDAEEAEVEFQLRQGAEDRAEEVLAEDDPEQYEDQQSAEGDAEPASQADDEEDDEPRSEYSSLDVQAGTPQMFDGDCEQASSFLDSWDRWSAQLSPCFTQYQRATLFLSLFQDPVDQWAEERLENIEEWRASLCREKESAAEYADANGSEEDPDDASSVDHEEDSSWEVSPSPSLCYPDDQASEDEPDEVDEYVEEPRGDAREQYDHQDRVTTRDEEYASLVEDYSSEDEDDLVDEYYYSAEGKEDANAEKRVPPAPRNKKRTRADKQKPPKVKKVKIAARDSTSRAESPPTTSWEKKFIAKFGKGRLQDLRNAGVPDYMIEADLYEDAPLTTTQDTIQKLEDLFVNRPDLRGDIMDEMQRPTATTASWEGPNTFDSAPKRTPRKKRKPPRTPGGLHILATPTQWTLPPEEDEPELKLSATIAGRPDTLAGTALTETNHDAARTSDSTTNNRSWINQYNNEDEPRRRLPQAAPRGRSPTVKPVHGSNHPSPTIPMTDEEFADRLTGLEIRRARAVTNQDWKAVQDLDFKANLALAVRATMKKKPPTLEEIEEELQKTETRLARALINGTATDIRRLDCAANRMAEEVMKRDIDYCPAMLTTANVLLQRGRCSRKEGNVTVSPSTVPRSPAKTPKNTAIRRSPSDIAEEETQVMRLVAESARPTKAESRDYYYHPGSAQKPWE
ncbi:hypothetical protein EDB84DRAFT_1566631 [Lactarius hengduanensis]|nr:hypothetical protein EDB84DRAFT_1566631 [Lactarius hengduanensis]